MPNAEAEAILQTILRTEEGRRDPYPLYHRLRAIAPVHRTEHGPWYLSRYDDCAAAVRDPRLGKNYAKQTELRIGPNWRQHLALARGELSMLNLDGPAHTRLRRLVVKAFTPKTVAAMRPKIEAMVDRLIEPLAEAGGGDVMEAIAFPLPVSVIGELLGVPENERAQFRWLVRDVTGVFEPNLSETIEAANRASRVIGDYFTQLLAEKRRKPTDDMLSRLVNAEDGDDRLSDAELRMLASGVFGAGFETTTNMIGNGLLALLDNPHEMARLRREPALHATVPAELLRYDSSVQLTTRFTKADVEVGGETIPEGVPVMMLLGAANRDPARYADPDRLDVGRKDVQPLSFGGGVHYCLGAALAEVEIEIVFRKLFERFETIELAGERPRFRSRLALRGLESLKVACRTSAKPAAVCPYRGSELGLRPRAGSNGAEHRWREALRSRVETQSDRGGSIPSGCSRRSCCSRARHSFAVAPRKNSASSRRPLIR